MTPLVEELQSPIGDADLLRSSRDHFSVPANTTNQFLENLRNSISHVLKIKNQEDAHLALAKFFENHPGNCLSLKDLAVVGLNPGFDDLEAFNPSPAPTGLIHHAKRWFSGIPRITHPLMTRPGYPRLLVLGTTPEGYICETSPITAAYGRALVKILESSVSRALAHWLFRRPPMVIVPDIHLGYSYRYPPSFDLIYNTKCYDEIRASYRVQGKLADMKAFRTGFIQPFDQSPDPPNDQSSEGSDSTSEASSENSNDDEGKPWWNKHFETMTKIKNKGLKSFMSKAFLLQVFNTLIYPILISQEFALCLVILACLLFITFWPKKKTPQGFFARTPTVVSEAASILTKTFAALSALTLFGESLKKAKEISHLFRPSRAERFDIWLQVLTTCEPEMSIEDKHTNALHLADALTDDQITNSLQHKQLQPNLIDEYKARQPKLDKIAAATGVGIIGLALIFMVYWVIIVIRQWFLGPLTLQEWEELDLLQRRGYLTRHGLPPVPPHVLKKMAEQYPRSKPEGGKKRARVHKKASLSVKVRKPKQSGKKMVWIYDLEAGAWEGVAEDQLDQLYSSNNYAYADEYRSYLLQNADRFDLTQEQYEELMSNAFDPNDWFKLTTIEYIDSEDEEEVEDENDFYVELRKDPRLKNKTDEELEDHDDKMRSSSTYRNRWNAAAEGKPAQVENKSKHVKKLIPVQEAKPQQAPAVLIQQPPTEPPKTKDKVKTQSKQDLFDRVYESVTKFARKGKKGEGSVPGNVGRVDLAITEFVTAIPSPDGKGYSHGACIGDIFITSKHVFAQLGINDATRFETSPIIPLQEHGNDYLCWILKNDKRIRDHTKKSVNYSETHKVGSPIYIVAKENGQWFSSTGTLKNTSGAHDAYTREGYCATPVFQDGRVIGFHVATDGSSNYCLLITPRLSEEIKTTLSKKKGQGFPRAGAQ